MTQYDEIATDYQSVLEVPVRYLLEYNFQQHVGDVTGKTVLDLACGTGDFTRVFKERGASRVVGVDISPEMIKVAKKDEAEKPLGIEYQVGDARTLGKIGEFDLVVASFLLHYAATKEDLLKMCQTVYHNLKPGERFVTLNNNAPMSLDYYRQGEAYKKYACYPEVKSGTAKEGAVISWVVVMGENQITFDNYFFDQASYEWALSEAGFTKVVWHGLELPPRLAAQDGKEFWQYLLDHPFTIVLECQK